MKSGVSIGGLSRPAGLITDPILHRALLVALVPLIGLATVYLPLTEAIVLIVGSGSLISILVRPVIGLYLLIFAIPFGSLKEISFGVIDVGGAEALAALTIMAWLARMAAGREIKTVHPPLFVPLLIFLGVISFSLLGSLSLQWSLKGLLVWLELLAIYLFVVNVVDGRQVKIIVIFILLAGCLEGLLGFYQFFGRRGPEGFLLFDRFIRAYGTFEQPNPYGGYLALILPLALGLFLARWPWRDRWTIITWALAGLSLALMGAALVMSWSRGAWLGFLAGVVLVALAGFWHRALNDFMGGGFAGLASAGLGTIWFYTPSSGSVLAPLLGGLAGLGTGLSISVALHRRWAWLLLVFLLVFGGVFLFLGGERLLPPAVAQRFSDFLPYLEMPDVRAVHVTDENFAVVERLAHWQAALGMLNDHPLLGVGIGNYAPVYPGYALPGWEDPLGHAHNYYLHIAAESGLLGLGAYLLLILACFWHGWHTLREATGCWQGVALGIFGVLGAFAVHSLFDNLYVHGMNMHLAILLGLMYVLTKRCEVSVVETS